MYAIVAGRRPKAGLHPLTRERLAIALFLLAAALFLFVDRESLPIILWDESRNVMNALEMRRTGLGLVTTYDFAPDLWNTKPPLLIWLMYGSISLFGASEWALRLPSALAALATLLILILFVRRVTGSLATALGAGTLLLLSPGFFSEHGARTADYDALLLFFTTAYLQLLFLALHQRRPSAKLALLIGALIACAFLTKSTAGIIAGAGVPLYLLASKRLSRPLTAWRAYAVLAAAAVLPILLFLIAREAAAPGYLQAMLHNDLVGRFQHSLIGRATQPTMYLETLISGWFLAGPLLVLAPFALPDLRGRKRAVFLYSLIVGFAQLAVCSLSATRLAHYILPTLPWFATAVALAAPVLWAKHIATYWHARARLRPSPALFYLLAIAVIGGIVTVRSLDWRYRGMAESRFSAEGRYGALFEALAQRGIAQADAVDPGFILEEDRHATPLLDSYRFIWAERGLAVRHLPRMPATGGTLLVSCSPAVVSLLLTKGSDIGGVSGCAAVRLTATATTA
ncbi:MAG TPA: glycosyltransferase family 39 protein [Allosphingosinicella sp.]